MDAKSKTARESRDVDTLERAFVDLKKTAKSFSDGGGELNPETPFQQMKRVFKSAQRAIVTASRDSAPKAKKRNGKRWKKLATCGFNESKIELYKEMVADQVHETVRTSKVQIREAFQAEAPSGLTRFCSGAQHTGAKLTKMKEFAKLIKFNKTMLNSDKCKTSTTVLIQATIADKTVGFLKSVIKSFENADEETKDYDHYSLFPTQLDTEGVDSRIFAEVFGISLHQSTDHASYCGM